MVYPGAHRYLPLNHPYRQAYVAFNGRIETKYTPTRMFIMQTIAKLNEGELFLANPQIKREASLTQCISMESKDKV